MAVHEEMHRISCLVVITTLSARCRQDKACLWTFSARAAAAAAAGPGLLFGATLLLQMKERRQLERLLHLMRDARLRSVLNAGFPPPTTVRGRLAWHACCVGAWAMTSRGMPKRPLAFCLEDVDI